MKSGVKQKVRPSNDFVVKQLSRSTACTSCWLWVNSCNRWIMTRELANAKGQMVKGQWKSQKHIRSIWNVHTHTTTKYCFYFVNYLVRGAASIRSHFDALHFSHTYSELFESNMFLKAFDKIAHNKMRRTIQRLV